MTRPCPTGCGETIQGAFLVCRGCWPRIPGPVVSELQAARREGPRARLDAAKRAAIRAARSAGGGS
jgi:hypothetical protein